jgi:hypothetical protein
VAKDPNKGARLSEMTGYWQSGWATGAREGMETTLRILAEVRAQAQTDHGRVALDHAMKTIASEKKRRYPDD